MLGMFTFAEVAFPFSLILLLVMTPHLAAEAVSPLDANGVRLHGKSGEKVLVTSTAFNKGDPLLIVPSQLCLLAHRSGIIRGLGGQTDQLWDEVILQLAHQKSCPYFRNCPKESTLLRTS